MWSFGALPFLGSIEKGSFRLDAGCVCMTKGKRAIYRFFMTLARTWERLFIDLHVRGLEHIPSGPKIYVQNHITSTDPHWVLPLLPEPVHI
ncbi:MAG: hypothetical protein D6788_06980, partial [Planctomycetota bacterium]